jgi:hypothetical protein
MSNVVWWKRPIGYHIMKSFQLEPNASIKIFMKPEIPIFVRVERRPKYRKIFGRVEIK